MFNTIGTKQLMLDISYAFPASNTPPSRGCKGEFRSRIGRISTSVAIQNNSGIHASNHNNYRPTVSKFDGKRVEFQFSEAKGCDGGQGRDKDRIAVLMCRIPTIPLPLQMTPLL